MSVSEVSYKLVAFYVNNNNSTSLLLGTNTMRKIRYSMSYVSPNQMIVELGNQYAKTKFHVLLKDHESQQLSMISEVNEISLQPFETKKLSFTYFDMPDVRSNLDGKQVILSMDKSFEDHKLKYDEIGTMTNGRVTTHVRNESKLPFTLFKDSPLFSAKVVENDELIDIQPAVESVYIREILNAEPVTNICPCQIQDATIAFVCDRSGFNYILPSLTNPFTKSMDTHPSGVFAKGDYLYFVPSTDTEFIEFQTPDFLTKMLRSHKLKNNNLIVLYAEPILVTNALAQALFTWKKSIHVRMTQLTENALCSKCAINSLSTISLMPGFSSVNHVEFLLPSEHAVDIHSAEFNSVSNSERQRKSLFNGYLVDMFRSKGNSISLYFHIPQVKSRDSAFVSKLFVEASVM